MGEGDQSSPLLKPINPPELAPELLAPVQLVHQGSGFIVEGVISNLKNTRFSLPYPGRWEVFLTAQPEIVSPQASNDSGLRASLAEGQWTLPASMGIVEANSSVPQSVDCPLNCVKPPPDTLPETGITLAQDNSLIATLIVAGLSLILIGLHFIWPRGLAFLDIKLENLFK
jgi:hypothetical protein